MVKEYKIKFAAPPGYNPADLFKQMPSPIHRKTLSEIYNFKIENDGFYFVDSLVDTTVASVAFRLFIDEALKFGTPVEVTKL